MLQMTVRSHRTREIESGRKKERKRGETVVKSCAERAKRQVTNGECIGEIGVAVRSLPMQPSRSLFCQ